MARLHTEFLRIVPGSRAAGPARTVRCGQDDHLMVHVAIAQMRPGDVLALTMPRPSPVALVGDLIATQAKVHGAAALLVDAAVRDVDALADIGLPMWARWIRVHGSGKRQVGGLDVPVAVGGTVIRPGDLVVMDGDGVVVVEDHLVPQVHDAAVVREERERVRRAQLLAGALVYDLDNSSSEWKVWRMNGKPDGRRTRHEGRRPQLLSAAVDYVVEHGLAGLSMRPLAAGIGITHRTLLHHFGSKEDFLVELFREVRVRQRAELAPHLQELEALPLSRFPYDAWRRLGTERSEPLFRLFFEVWSHALQAPDRYGAFLTEVVGDWLPVVEKVLAREGCPPEQVPAVSGLIVAVFRGLMLDVLSTHDRRRIDSSFLTFSGMLDRMCTDWRVA